MLVSTSVSAAVALAMTDCGSSIALYGCAPPDCPYPPDTGAEEAPHFVDAEPSPDGPGDVADAATDGFEDEDSASDALSDVDGR